MTNLSFQNLVLTLAIGPISQVNISFLIYISSIITPQGTMSDCENFQLPENCNWPLTLGYFQKQVWKCHWNGYTANTHERSWVQNLYFVFCFGYSLEVYLPKKKSHPQTYWRVRHNWVCSKLQLADLGRWTPLQFVHLWPLNDFLHSRKVRLNVRWKVPYKLESWQLLILSPVSNCPSMTCKTTVWM